MGGQPRSGCCINNGRQRQGGKKDVVAASRINGGATLRSLDN